MSAPFSDTNIEKFRKLFAKAKKTNLENKEFTELAERMIYHISANNDYAIPDDLLYEIYSYVAPIVGNSDINRRVFYLLDDRVKKLNFSDKDLKLFNSLVNTDFTGKPRQQEMFTTVTDKLIDFVNENFDNNAQPTPEEISLHKRFNIHTPLTHENLRVKLAEKIKKQPLSRDELDTIKNLNNVNLTQAADIATYNELYSRLKENVTRRINDDKMTNEDKTLLKYFTQHTSPLRAEEEDLKITLNAKNLKNPFDSDITKIEPQSLWEELPNINDLIDIKKPETFLNASITTEIAVGGLNFYTSDGVDVKTNEDKISMKKFIDKLSLVAEKNMKDPHFSAADQALYTYYKSNQPNLNEDEKLLLSKLKYKENKYAESIKSSIKKKQITHGLVLEFICLNKKLMQAYKTYKQAKSTPFQNYVTPILQSSESINDLKMDESNVKIEISELEPKGIQASKKANYIRYQQLFQGEKEFAFDITLEEEEENSILNKFVDAHAKLSKVRKEIYKLDDNEIRAVKGKYASICIETWDKKNVLTFKERDNYTDLRDIIVTYVTNHIDSPKPTYADRYLELVLLAEEKMNPTIENKDILAALKKKREKNLKSAPPERTAAICDHFKPKSTKKSNRLNLEGKVIKDFKDMVDLSKANIYMRHEDDNIDIYKSNLKLKRYREISGLPQLFPIRDDMDGFNISNDYDYVEFERIVRPTIMEEGTFFFKF
jgi:hypothetical protein